MSAARTYFVFTGHLCMFTFYFYSEYFDTDIASKYGLGGGYGGRWKFLTFINMVSESREWAIIG